MKKIRDFSKKWALIFVPVFFAYACNTSSSKNSYDGETLFKGIFFGDGQFADKIPQYAELVEMNKSLSTEERAKLNEAEAYVIGEITKQDARFFERFKVQISSGNHVKIRSEILAASSLVQKHLLKFYEHDISPTVIADLHAKMNSKEFNPEGARQLDKDNISAIKKELLKNPQMRVGENQLAGVLTVGYVLAVAVAAVVAAALWFWVADPTTGGTIEQEQLINAIATEAHTIER